MKNCQIIIRSGLCELPIENESNRYCIKHSNCQYDKEFFEKIKDSKESMLELLLKFGIYNEKNIETTELSKIVYCFMAIMNEKDSENFTFETIKELAKGGMGQTFIVKRKSDGHQFIMKKSIKKREYEIKRQYMIIKEINKLKYPNLLYPIMIYKDPLDTYFIMTYFDNFITFQEMINKKINIDMTTRISIIKQMITSVDALHNHFIIHGDIKPSNIMIGPMNNLNNLRVVMIDFGLAKFKSSNYNYNFFEGTLQYMPPEMLKYKKYGIEPPKSSFEVHMYYDIWALGLCIVYLYKENYGHFIFDKIKYLKELYSLYRNIKLINMLDSELSLFLKLHITNNNDSNTHFLAYDTRLRTTFFSKAKIFSIMIKYYKKFKENIGFNLFKSRDEIIEYANEYARTNVIFTFQDIFMRTIKDRIIQYTASKEQKYYTLQEPPC